MNRPATAQQSAPGLRRVLGLWDLVFYGIVLIQPTAPMPLFGIVAVEARGHVALTVLIAMFGMLFTAISYGRMARAYPAAGSAYTYAGRELHPFAGYLTGWGMALDYVINPTICTIWCSKAARNILPEIPYAVWVVFFASLFTALNLRGIQASARTNRRLTLAMGAVILAFFAAAIRYLFAHPLPPAATLARPFYDPDTFQWPAVLTGTSIAALTYIGFDGISTLSEEVRNPRRNVLLATVYTCLITGLLATVQVYMAQLVWPDYSSFPDPDTAFVSVAGRAGGIWLFHLVNFTLLIATVGSGSGAQLGAARLLYGMGRERALPEKFFGSLDPKTAVPRNNVLLVGAVAMAGGFLMSYQLGAELLNFGAFIAFMGVNLSAFVRYFVRHPEKRWTYAVPPLLGFLLSFYIWLNLRWAARLAGFIWLSVGAILWFSGRRRLWRPFPGAEAHEDGTAGQREPV